MKKDSLGDRMKSYENCYRIKIPKKSNILMRIDGKSFHNFTKGMKIPYDEGLSDSMIHTMKFICENISGAKFAYTQSDEISILISDRDDIYTEPWFDNNLQKMASVGASMATASFNKKIEQYYPERGMAFFDSRVYVIPIEDVANYFIWRQQDATRNSIQMAARAAFSHKQCENKNQSQLQDMLMLEKNINWNDYPTRFKRGTAAYREPVKMSEEELNLYTKENKNLDVIRMKWFWNKDIPIFTQDRNFIERHLV